MKRKMYRTLHWTVKKRERGARVKNKKKQTSFNVFFSFLYSNWVSMTKKVRNSIRSFHSLYKHLQFKLHQQCHHSSLHISFVLRALLDPAGSGVRRAENACTVLVSFSCQGGDLTGQTCDVVKATRLRGYKHTNGAARTFRI